MNQTHSSTTHVAHNSIVRREPVDVAPVVLTEDDAAGIAAAVEAAQAPATRRTYGSLWRAFGVWCQARGFDSLPADHRAVAAYLVARSHIVAPATVRLDAAAIGHQHRVHLLPNPAAYEGVKVLLDGLDRRNHGGSQKQARGISRADLAAIKATACRPRPGRGGRLESWQQARARGFVDHALCAVMFDAMLRRGEAAVLVWSDMQTAADGSGRLVVRYSKTDQRGEKKVLWISPETMLALDLLSALGEDGDGDRIFPLSPQQINRRIAAACAAAGLGDGYSGHSLRVGGAQAMAAANISLASIMESGRWQSSRMPARYTRYAAAARSGMAQLYAKGG